MWNALVNVGLRCSRFWLMGEHGKLRSYQRWRDDIVRERRYGDWLGVLVRLHTHEDRLIGALVGI